VEPRHRLKLLDEDIKNRILAARTNFRDNLPQDLAGSIEFYDPETYNSASSIEANILFGRITYGVAEASSIVKNAIQKVVDQLNLHDEIFNVGLNYNVGTGGKRLSIVQQQKLALARVLLKQPDILIGNNLFTSLDKQNRSANVEKLLDLARGKADTQKPFGLFLYVSEPELAMKFDRVLAFEDGVLVEQGTPDELIKKKGLFVQLLAKN
jgi:putative ABC transport system ATP-binding protein